LSDSISFDFSEINALAADLGKVPGNAGENIRKAFTVTSLKTKRDAAAEVSKSPTWKAAAAAISYDIKTDGHTIESEVGYDKSVGAGPLGNLREYGAPGKQLAPHNDLANALEKNSPDFQSGLEKALRDAEAQSGL
jgi:hypothetical protein